MVTGGSIISYVPDLIAMSHSGFLGPEGKCFSFDHRAEGYGRGEGVGSIVLKTLANAIRDGDTIRAVIRGTGVNQDGRTPGITLPSSTAQSRLIREVYSRAELDPNVTMFVEAHGTGTAAGDPIEARGIVEGFASTERESPLYIGALKSNIGHLEGGAGIAGIIKSIMILESGIIPPNVNFEKVNPKIPTTEWNINFPTECTPWPTSGLRRASVNCFGFGGTNAHCVLDDAYHYLKEHGLPGHHVTRETVPTKQEISERLTALKGSHIDKREALTSRTELNTAGPNGVLENDEAPATSRIELNDDVPNGVHEIDGAPATNGTELNNGVPIGIDETSETSAPSGTVIDGDHVNGDAPNGVLGAEENSCSGVVTNGDQLSGDPMGEMTAKPETPRVILLSASDKEGISRVAAALKEYLASKHDLPLQVSERFFEELAYTLSERRSRLRWKSYLLANSISELEKSLGDERVLSKPFNARNPPRLGFVFTGQGAQYHCMGQQLLVYPVFRRSLEDATEYMRSLGSSWSLIGM